jgi:hypothetical protein
VRTVLSEIYPEIVHLRANYSLTAWPALSKTEKSACSANRAKGQPVLLITIRLSIEIEYNLPQEM